MRKNLLFLLFTLGISLSVVAQTVTTNPSPVVSTGSAKIILNQSTGTDYYIWTWVVAGGTSVPAFSDWNAAINASTKFTSEGSGVFSFNIASLKSFYNLSDAQLATVTQIGILVRKADGTKLTPNDLTFAVSQAPIQQYSGGEGTLALPYLISNSADLIKLSTTKADWGKCFKVTAAVVATNVTSPIGDSATPFTGSFDGGNFDISGSSLSGTSDVAFFGVINGASITKVSLRNVNISATGNNVAGLVGVSMGSSNVSASSVTGSVTGQGGGVGGFVGNFKSGNISTSYSAASVSSNYGSGVGGFVGIQTGATSVISDCYATGAVVATSSTAVGGFAGKIDNSALISTSYATGNVTSGNEYVGGFVGASYGSIQNCFAATATITASGNYVAQFGGNNNGENISTGAIAWTGVSLSSGSFSGFGESGVLKSSAPFNTQAMFDGVSGMGFTFSSSKWRWDGASYPALAVTTAQTYPYPFSQSTPIIKVEANGDFKIYPTCVTSSFTVDGENLSRVVVVSLVGSIVLDNSDFSPSQTENIVSVEGLSSGIYVVKVYDVKGAIETAKIIKR